MTSPFPWRVAARYKLVAHRRAVFCNNRSWLHYSCRTERYNCRDSNHTLISRITSVGLFKNGLAVVKRTVKLPGPGTYRIDDVPQPVHGTF